MYSDLQATVIRASNFSSEIETITEYRPWKYIKRTSVGIGSQWKRCYKTLVWLLRM